jgi:hypothetical protein
LAVHRRQLSAGAGIGAGEETAQRREHRQRTESDDREAVGAATATAVRTLYNRRRTLLPLCDLNLVRQTCVDANTAKTAMTATGKKAMNAKTPMKNAKKAKTITGKKAMNAKKPMKANTAKTG